MSEKSRISKDGGFTLVELIVVITIIAVLAAIIVPVVGNYVEDANRTRVMANAKNVYVACMVVAANDLAMNVMSADYQGIPDLGQGDCLDKVLAYAPFTGTLTASSDSQGRIVSFRYKEGLYTFGLVSPYGDKPDYNFDPNPKELPG